MDVRIAMSTVFGVVLWACTAGTKGPVTEPAAPASEVGPVAIVGQLRAHDGSALRDAEVIIERTGFSEPPITPSLDDEGSFRVEVPPGVYRIALDAPDHRAVSRTTVVSDGLRVEGRLRASARVEAEGAAQAPPLRWTGESPTTVALRDFYGRWLPAIIELRERSPNGNPFTMPEALRVEARELAARARAEIDAQTDPTTHGLLRAAHLALFYVFCLPPGEGAALQEDIVWVVDHTSPVDLHWALPNVFSNFHGAFTFAGAGRDEAFMARVEPWLERRAREHAVPTIAVAALGLLIFDAKEQGHAERLAELEALTEDERHRGLFGREGRSAPPRRSPGGSLEVGQPLPSFDFPALGEPDRRITSAERRGRLYLLEMWSTTCGPCVAEMPNLHAAYAAIHGVLLDESGDEAALRGLEPVENPRIELVSVSVVDSERDIETFRKEGWSMPWTHARLGDQGMRELWVLFGVRAIPASVLVDENGKVLAMGDALRGDALLPTLQRVLAERDPKSP